MITQLITVSTINMVFMLASLVAPSVEEMIQLYSLPLVAPSVEVVMQLATCNTFSGRDDAACQL